LSGRFWLKGKSRKTCDIIVSTKSTFFDSNMGAGAGVVMAAARQPLAKQYHSQPSRFLQAFSNLLLINGLTTEC
jgi:hypothetical protein